MPLWHRAVPIDTLERVTAYVSTQFPSSQHSGEIPANDGFVVQGALTPAAYCKNWAWVPFANRAVFDGGDNAGCPALFVFFRAADGSFIGFNMLLGAYCEARYLDRWLFFAGPEQHRLSFDMLHDRPRTVRLPAAVGVDTCAKAAEYFTRLVAAHQLQRVYFHVVRRTCLVSNLQAWHGLTSTTAGSVSLFAHVRDVLIGSDIADWLPAASVLRAGASIQGEDSAGMDVNVAALTTTAAVGENRLAKRQRLLSFLRKQRYELVYSQDVPVEFVADADFVDDEQASQGRPWAALPAASAAFFEAASPETLLSKIDWQHYAPAPLLAKEPPPSVPVPAIDQGAVQGAVQDAVAVRDTGVCNTNAVFVKLLRWLRTRSTAFKKRDILCALCGLGVACKPTTKLGVRKTALELVRAFADAQVLKNITHATTPTKAKRGATTSAWFTITSRGRHLLENINCMEDLDDLRRRGVRA